MLFSNIYNIETPTHESQSYTQHMRLTCKIELSKLAAIVTVIILGRLFCLAVNDPGTYDSFTPIDDAPLESVCVTKKDKIKKIYFLLLDGLFIVLYVLEMNYINAYKNVVRSIIVRYMDLHHEKEFTEKIIFFKCDNFTCDNLTH